MIGIDPCSDSAFTEPDMLITAQVCAIVHQWSSSQLAYVNINKKHIVNCQRRKVVFSPEYPRKFFLFNY